MLLSLRASQHEKQMRIAACRAGEAGVQLAAALRLAGNHIIVTFLDDNPVRRRSVNGVAIQPPQVLTALKNFSTAYLAIFKPGANGVASSTTSSAVLSQLQVPSVDDLTRPRHHRYVVADCTEDLLGRDVACCSRELGPGIRSAVVCVTGAGGSIARAPPPDPGVVAGKLILLERSEPASCH